MNKYYNLWDLQCKKYLHSGKNSTTLDELKEALIEYISIDFEDDKKDRKYYEKIDVHELATQLEMEIHKTTEKLSENDY